ncbi:MAG: carboxypeptidase M32, partial [Trueperaceae bacterium]|nr:carboxypeptidase M32 [Trueperaceae bacterium]
MPNSADRLTALRERLAVVAHISQAGALLSWDQSTHMPPGGAEARGRQMATLARLGHQHATDPALVGLVEDLEGDGLEGDDRALVRETRRMLDRALKMPADLVAAMTRQRVRGRQVWERARREDDFAAFAPELRAMIDLTREQAAALNGEAPAYDVLHDLYERGSTAERVEAVFGPLRDEIVDLARAIRESEVRPDTSVLRRDFPEAAQEAFAVETVRAMGYDFERGRIDRTAHPFATTIGPGDVRITTRYQRNFLSGALFGTIHEAGHGMYNQNLPAEHADTPLGASVSLAIHESQSRLWENLVGRSRAFWEGAYPRLRAAFPGVLDDVPLEAFVAAINDVRPSLIRVEADEVTYHLHVMLRFELERALVEGSLEVDDLPGAWAEKSRELLGIEPPDDRDGCLQDVHWSWGMFGYFPTYSLGTLASVQLWEAMARDLGDLEALVRAGRFAPILAWLVEHVHRHGSRFAPEELLERATGGPLSA